MCIILSSDKGKLLNRENLETSFKSNGDGIGFSYVKDGKLLLEKGFFDFEEFYKAYQKTENYSHIIHFRYKTHGAKDKLNCHPFVVSENKKYDENNKEIENENELLLVMAHNGVLSSFGNKEKDMSDTYSFIKEILNPLSRDTQGKPWWKNKGLQWLLESSIGSNKLVFLDNLGEITIINESAGEWVGDKSDGIWASNSSYKILKNRSYTQNFQNYSYESDYLNYHSPGNQTHAKSPGLTDAEKAANLSKNKDLSTNLEKVTIDNVWNVSEEELTEIDAYLEALNDDVPANSEHN